MKIILTGGGSGGHFYPLMAVAEQVRKISEDRKLLQPKIYYVSDQSYDEDLLFKNEIIFKKLSSGKMRRYFSILNFFDFFKTGWATFKAIIMVFAIYPDVIFSNGGFGSFPILLAGRIFNIPIFDKLLLCVSGILTIVWIILYLFSLEIEETSAVVPWFLSVPVFGYILGYFFSVKHFLFNNLSVQELFLSGFF